MLSGAELLSARYEERSLTKIKDLEMVRIRGVRNQSERVTARTKKEISHKWNE